eukprot:CAMPEP_0195120500 /NCGR_PEP_ID=MMETSP0448-20130528/121993_1 /TAXON_ID=66468 /ORGANISM="Heterocapsa triquestra, Strain CCMP 448" /LENGTH=42 /DNA_ID= /DNA_START= /DNA_END= /DNA_ORIENTATION=
MKLKGSQHQPGLGVYAALAAGEKGRKAAGEGLTAGEEKGLIG